MSGHVSEITQIWTRWSYYSAAQFARKLSQRFERDTVVTASGRYWSIAMQLSIQEARQRVLEIKEMRATAVARGKQLKEVADRILAEIDGVAAGYGVTSEWLERLRRLSLGSPIAEEDFPDLSYFVEGMESRVFRPSPWTQPWREDDPEPWP